MRLLQSSRDVLALFPAQVTALRSFLDIQTRVSVSASHPVSS